MRRLVADTYGLVCVLCHEKIEQLDHMDIEHVISRHERPDLMWDIDNMRPSHGYRSPKQYRCNQRRGTTPLATYEATRAVDRLSLFKPADPVAAPRPAPIFSPHSEKNVVDVEPRRDVSDWIEVSR